MKQIFLFLSLSLTIHFVQAQEGWESGGWIGTSNYFGDLNTNFAFKDPGIAAGVVFRYNFNNRVALKFAGNYGQIAADDADSDNIFERARNLNFQSEIFDGSAQVEFNFLPLVHGSYTEFFTPYLSGGLVVYNFNPKTELDGRLIELRPLGTEGQFRGEEYFGTQIGVAYGGGIKFSMNYVWSINVHVDARWLFSDYLDDVSTVFADPDDIANLRGEDAAILSNRAIDLPGVEANFAPGTQRGDQFNNDTYVFIGVGLMYYFGDLKCPNISKK